MGLSSAADTLQRLMNEAVWGMEKFAHAYLDYLVIFSGTMENN